MQAALDIIWHKAKKKTMSQGGFFFDVFQAPLRPLAAA